jgi:hypothetical protein
MGYDPVLYSRTVSNYVFDAVVRRALVEFADDPDIRVIPNTQTVKFCFGQVVLARFKKGDEDNLGRNQPTQAVIDFIYAQGTLPGIPPEAAKVEILYSATEIEDAIESVIVAARDGDKLVWHYDVDGGIAPEGVIPFPQPSSPEDPDGDDDQLIKPRIADDEETDSGEGD